MSPRRRTVAAILVAIGAIVYGISPFDVIPDLITGLLGYADDGAVWIGAAIGIWKLLSGRGKDDSSSPPTAA